MNKKTVNDIYLDGKRVLMRVDYNVPIDKDGTIADDARIRETLPTIRLLSAKGAAVILMAHFGRAAGDYEGSVDLVNLSQCLQALLNHDVNFEDAALGREVEIIVGHMGPGQVLLLEDLHFNAHDENDDPTFAQRLANVVDAYVCDAFDAAHRTYAETEGVVRLLRAQGKPCVIGLLMEQKLNERERLSDDQALPGLMVIDDKVS